MTKLLGGSSKSFKSKLITKAEAEAEAFTYDPDLYDDDDDDDGDGVDKSTPSGRSRDKKDVDIDKYRKKLFMLMRIIECMMRSGFSIGQIVAHLTYHTTITTVQGSELLVNLTMNSLVTSYDIATAIMNWLNTNGSEEVELNTTLQSNGGVDLSTSSPPISINSSPPITVNSSSTHTVNSSSSSEDNANYEIAPLTAIPVPTDAESEDADKDKVKNNEKPYNSNQNRKK